ncbi:MAG: tyrosine-type recombinase/integrase [Gordonia sp. (in: high G+C Gram-positive bacteria)]|uniref:site-specific integrase n=1 Tax=Gordonia sp. (in: high G+C Gram-positive bacteria) TaxID=84139 RepID=UPI0039E4861D
MGRPPLAVGTYGNIATTTLPNGFVRASTWVRDSDGRRRRVERRAKTKAAAIAALKAAMVDRKPPPDPGAITPETRVKALGEHWLKQVAATKRPQTKQTYEANLKKLVYPTLGGLQLRELSASRVQGLYDKLGKRAPNAATPLRMMLDVAVRCDALPANPARQAAPAPRSQDQGVILTAAQLLDLRKKITVWADGELSDERGKTKRRGAGRRAMPDFFDLAVATGARTAELLAVRWEDIDLSADPPTLTVTGILVQVSGKGTIRQPFTKSDAGHRQLALPPFAAVALRDRRTRRRLGVIDDAVFPADDGGYMSSSTMQGEWLYFRRAAGYPDAELRSLRRSVATLIADNAGIDAAAAQLGHADTGVTSRHYVSPRAAVAPDLTTVLQALA